MFHFRLIYSHLVSGVEGRLHPNTLSSCCVGVHWLDCRAAQLPLLTKTNWQSTASKCAFLEVTTRCAAPLTQPTQVPGVTLDPRAPVSYGCNTSVLETGSPAGHSSCSPSGITSSTRAAQPQQTCRNSHRQLHPDGAVRGLLSSSGAGRGALSHVLAKGIVLVSCHWGHSILELLLCDCAHGAQTSFSICLCSQ
jgi:hypothetical protein